MVLPLSTQEREENLRKVIDCISGNGLKVKISMCESSRPHAMILVHIVDLKGVSMDTSNILAVNSNECPYSV